MATDTLTSATDFEKYGGVVIQQRHAIVRIDLSMLSQMTGSCSNIHANRSADGCDLVNDLAKDPLIH